MVEIITYPKRLFDKMVKKGNYESRDFFLSIGQATMIEGDEPAVPYSDNFLRVNFDDVVMDVLGAKAITSEQGKMISDFAKTVSDNTTLHIHCAAGVSRSTASAKAIREILEYRGIKTDHKRLGESYHPNPTVYEYIMKAYNA